MEETANSAEDYFVFHPDLLVIPENGEPPYLTAYSCEDCGTTWFPRLPYCPNCWCEKLEKKPLSRKGKLYSYTKIQTNQPGIKSPYLLGYVDFPEKVRVLAQIEAEIEKLKPDMDVEVISGVIRENYNGKIVISYKIKPVNS